MEDDVFRRTTLLLETNSLMQEYANGGYAKMSPAAYAKMSPAAYWLIFVKKSEISFPILRVPP